MDDQETKISRNLHPMSNLSNTFVDKDSECQEMPLCPEKTLSDIGFTTNDPISWEKVKLPPRTSLFDRIMHKVHNFM